jgi:hypothetical protein
MIPAVQHYRVGSVSSWYQHAQVLCIGCVGILLYSWGCCARIALHFVAITDCAAVTAISLPCNMWNTWCAAVQLCR